MNEKDSRFASGRFQRFPASATQIERATIYLDHGNQTNKDFINSWFSRWQGAVIMRSQETLTSRPSEMYDIIAPARALNELPNAVVVRY